MSSKTGLKGDPIFDAFYASQVQFQNDTIIVQNITQRAGAALLDRIGPAIVITHSQAGPLGFLIADTRPASVRALISLEPQGPPFEDRILRNSTAIARPYGLTNIPIEYDPPVVDPATALPYMTLPPPGPGLSDCILQASPARRLVNLAKIPHLVVTSQASYHAAYDYCTVRYLQQGGVIVDFLDLPHAEIHGNAHFVFLERNNLEIAAKVEEWIRKNVTNPCEASPLIFNHECEPSSILNKSLSQIASVATPGMASRKKAAKPKLNPSSSGSLDSYISPKKSVGQPDASESGLDDPHSIVAGPESTASTPASSQPLKRKRADKDMPNPKCLVRKNTNEDKGRRAKGYAPPSTYDHLPPLTDTLIPNLLCVTVGLNPGIQTATKGHPYAHPSNLYWYLLHTSGLSPDRRLAPSEYVILPEKYSIGNTNIVSRATRDGSELSKEEMVVGAGELDEKIRKWKPEVVCLVGKSIWEAVWKWRHGKAMKKQEFKYGFQDKGENMGRRPKKKSNNFFEKPKRGADKKEDDADDEDLWDGAKVFVATSTSGLAASLSKKEKEEIWAELGSWVQRRREERRVTGDKGMAVDSVGDNDAA
ncbi:uncharacterized protein KY384_000878 [Bacidia gigantensis]|uniref:uncharacterized protein n=1 Tax=Bacidia gigantensis TaxID=2732470 RepID=UPI001D040882|nr:uncharacterized protein KY384_000878 [Bacidia gigantensis]KAG8534035.1 hypothetical protein KY384_000878 [Bacidia gigantensis]